MKVDNYDLKLELQDVVVLCLVCRIHEFLPFRFGIVTPDIIDAGRAVTIISVARFFVAPTTAIAASTSAAIRSWSSAITIGGWR
jgi:hypothetical protein